MPESKIEMIDNLITRVVSLVENSPRLVLSLTAFYVML